MRISDWSSDVCSSDLGVSLTDEALHRRHVDDRTAAAFDHVRDLVLHAQELADEIDVEDEAKHRLIPRRIIRVGDAGIVECTIKSAENRNGLLDEGFDVGSLRYVPDNQQCVAARGPNLPHGLRAVLPVVFRTATPGPLLA